MLAIQKMRASLHAAATASLGRFAENLDYIPGPPVEGTGKGGDGTSSDDEEHLGKLQIAHSLVSTLDKRSQVQGASGLTGSIDRHGNGRGGGSGDALDAQQGHEDEHRRRKTSFADMQSEAHRIALPGETGRRRSATGSGDPNEFPRVVATDRKPMKLPWYDVVCYAAQRMNCSYTRRKLLSHAKRPMCLQFVEECFWLLHLQLFGGLGDEAAGSGSGSGSSGEPGSGLAPAMQQELVLQRISRLYVRIVSGTKHNKDRFLDHLPFLTSAATHLAYFYCLPGSRPLYTP